MDRLSFSHPLKINSVMEGKGKVGIVPILLSRIVAKLGGGHSTYRKTEELPTQYNFFNNTFIINLFLVMYKFVSPFCELTIFILLFSKFLSESCCISSSPFTISKTVPSSRQVAIPERTSYVNFFLYVLKFKAKQNPLFTF